MKHTTAIYVATTATALLVTLGSTSAFAFGSASAGSSATHFEGFTLGVDLDSDLVTTRYRETFKGYTDESSTRTNGFLNLSSTGIYRVALSDNWLLGGGVKLQLTDSNFDGSPNNERLTASQTWFLTPGYAFSNKIMVFGKLGGSSRSMAGGPKWAFGDQSLQGRYYGLGVQYAFSPKLHWTLEYAATDYSEVSIPKSNGYYGNASDGEKSVQFGTGTLSVGMAYRF